MITNILPRFYGTQCISQITFIADTFDIGIQQYADDTQYVSLTMTDMHARQSLLSDYLSALHSSFCHNGLALNSTKSECILIGTGHRLCTLPPIASLTIAGTPIPFPYTTKTLGVTLDQNLSLTRMWANARRDGRPAKYRWRPLFNAAKFD